MATDALDGEGGSVVGYRQQDRSKGCKTSVHHTEIARKRGDMSQPLVYIDSSDVRPGALAELRNAISELAEFIAANEPQLIAYHVSFSDDGRRMTVLHLHPDAASLDYHLDVAGPRFGRFANLLTLASIQIFGEPSPKAVGQLREKVQLLGSGDVIVQPLHAGFSRAPPG